MAVQSPPFALQNGSHSAALFRQALTSVFVGAGPLDSVSYVVAQQGTPNMSVQVAAGQAWVDGTSVSNISGQNFSTQGFYYALNDAPVTLTIAAADPTNPRIDLVYLVINDQFYTGSLNTAALGVVTGTPAGSPSTPATPTNALALATVRVNANATSITNSNITAVNTGTGAGKATVAGTPLACTSSTRPTGIRTGQMIFETDTGNTLVWNGSAWKPLPTNFPRAFAHQSTVQTGLASGWNAIKCQTADLDTHGALNANGRFTVPTGQAGTYAVEGGVVFDSVAAGAAIICEIRKNGAVFAGSVGTASAIPSAAAAGLSQVSGRKLLSLNVGDFIETWGFNNGGTWNTLVGSDGTCWLSVERIS